MTRAILIVLDSFGIGGAADAAAYGDVGADTFGHIAAAANAGKADTPGLRSGPLHLPNMAALGLYAAAGLEHAAWPTGLYGRAAEISSGKDTPSGHWELAGVPVLFDWGYFPDTQPAFPEELIGSILSEAGIVGSLGNCHASGTEIIHQLGAQSLATGWPIFYTSADSVMQIAAHEEAFGLQRLYALCKIARRHVDPLNIGRVIARPFAGTDVENFKRTANRRDFAIPPPEPTLMDSVISAGGQVHAVGKIADIFAHQGISQSYKADGNMALFDKMLSVMDLAKAGDLIFVNLVDFDTLYGHRRDVAGYAAALEAFDKRLPELSGRLRSGDLAIITADHGCDPTWSGSEHTRENVPVLAFGPDITAGPIGQRQTFSDVGASIARHLGLPALRHGNSFLKTQNGAA
ncbi:phosphopentomutase [Aureimonas fodinaquatilis]|uniref:Phosphopentomutase n=1 Tax=Aureimonas fodinaquatilis TaxID=2565783 RepID=A0A5B0E247_9HYPH|nr:phosphopentomutase [Aureimonas fodinaquatilis]KAA0972031.1 phosphopentomutase [Aureimonas fodinaquatilis]